MSSPTPSINPRRSKIALCFLRSIKHAVVSPECFLSPAQHILLTSVTLQLFELQFLLVGPGLCQLPHALVRSMTHVGGQQVFTFFAPLGRDVVEGTRVLGESILRLDALLRNSRLRTV
eukprot:m.620272 g.620272  ORF g.620272 m.620272 type:complete len:118 (+) comp22534_c0_seq3:299-652(+)